MPTTHAPTSSGRHARMQVDSASTAAISVSSSISATQEDKSLGRNALAQALAAASAVMPALRSREAHAL